MKNQKYKNTLYSLSSNHKKAKTKQKLNNFLLLFFVLKTRRIKKNGRTECDNKYSLFMTFMGTLLYLTEKIRKLQKYNKKLLNPSSVEENIHK